MAVNHDVNKLIKGCRAGKRASQIHLYEHFYSYGMAISLRYSKNREEALEILNDGFLKAFQKIDQYKPGLPFKPWLRRILINTAIDYYRKYHTLNQPVEYHESSNETFNDALDNLAYEDLLVIVRKLPPAYRLVFNLYVIEGLSHQDISDRLGISVGTSKSNLAKARKKIKTMLGASHGIYFKLKSNG